MLLLAQPGKTDSRDRDIRLQINLPTLGKPVHRCVPGLERE
jgi:hypothetical protein